MYPTNYWASASAALTRLLVATTTTALLASCSGEKIIPSSPPPPPPVVAPSITLSTKSVADTIGAALGNPLVITLRRGTAPIPATDISLTVSPSLVSFGQQNGPYAATMTAKTDANGNLSAFEILGSLVGEGTIAVEAPALGLRDTVHVTVRTGNLASVVVGPRDTAVFVNATFGLRYDLRDRAGNVVAGSPDIAGISGLTGSTIAGTFTAGPVVTRGFIAFRTPQRIDTAYVSVVPRDTMVFTWFDGTWYRLATVGLDGRRAQTFGPPIAFGPFINPGLSPNKLQVVANQGGGWGAGPPPTRIYVNDASQTATEIGAATPSLFYRMNGHFSHAGDWIFFRVNSRDDSTGVWRVRPDGTGLELLLARAPTDYIWDMYPFPDDKSLLIIQKASHTAEIFHGYRFDIASRFMTDLGAVMDGDASVSPLGNMIAWYGAHIGGLWITNADGSNSRQISDIVGYTAPAWTRDGKYVLAGGSLIDVMTGAVIPIPWVSNAALHWTFVEAGARP